MAIFTPVALRRWLIGLVAGLATLTITLLALADTQTDLFGPPGSASFGQQVVVLSNGNIVVTDPGYDLSATVTDAGAVYLYDGATGALISQLVGSTAGDQIGSGVTALTNGNFVVFSRHWDNGAATDAGAVTWGNGTTGITSTVSTANSLVGSTAGDQVGSGGVTALPSGNYVVFSPSWYNSTTTAPFAGAVTWGNGTTGITGAVTAANSLVGDTPADQVGSGGMVVLTNGNYIVLSPYWRNGAVTDAGAVTWGNGTTGITGAVTAANSLVGSTAGDQVGSDGIMVLPNGHFVVASTTWDNGTATDAGAVTWGNGTTGVVGAVSAANSLVGSAVSDQVGYYQTALPNGNYVVDSRYWNNGATTDVGAVTWGSGTTGITGAVSVTNSLVGSSASDQVGAGGITALTNGNYVVLSLYWDYGVATNAGAVTWGSGTTGITGVVSATNSLVGSTAGDQIGYYGIRALPNGNYVVWNLFWDNNGVKDAGAVTWVNGTTGITGTVSAANSLVGSAANDLVGYGGVRTLTNNNYVVSSRYWDNGTTTDAGAVTWSNGTTGTTGTVSATNSLVGSTTGDQVGSNGITALLTGNYVVFSRYWDNSTAADAGAVTWSSGTTGITGTVSAANSLVGSTAGDQIGYGANYKIEALSNGNYVVLSPLWDNGTAIDVGAVTWGSGATGVKGFVSAANSLVGSAAGDQVGYYETVLSGGNYIVWSRYWDNSTVTDAGAVTWGNGTTGITGTISDANSLVGSAAGDQVGFGGIAALPNGNYVVTSRYWNNGATIDAGAVTWGDGRVGTIGPISADNSVRGTAAGGGSSLSFADDTRHYQLVVGRPADTIVTLFSYPAPTGPRWDANGDHIVNILDVAQVGMHWGLTGAPGWTPEDVNSDGVVGIFDIALIGVHWGETW